MYIDVISQLSESLLSATPPSPPSSILERTYKLISSRVATNNTPSLIVIDDLSSLLPLVTPAIGLGFTTHLNSLSLSSSSTSTLTLCGADAHLNSLPSPHALTDVAGAISGELGEQYINLMRFVMLFLHSSLHNRRLQMVRLWGNIRTSD